MSATRTAVERILQRRLSDADWRAMLAENPHLGDGGAAGDPTAPGRFATATPRSPRPAGAGCPPATIGRQAGRQRRITTGGACPAAGLHFRLADRVASAKNSTKRLQLGPRLVTVKSDAARAWQTAAVTQLVEQRPADLAPIGEPVRVHVALHGPLDHPWSVDGDNGQSAVWDALVRARILVDDRPAVVRGWSGEWREAPTWSAHILVTPYPLATPEP